MATDVNERPGIAGNWKTRVLVGLALFLIGIVGLSGIVQFGGEAVQWTTSTALVLVGLTIAMYGFATIT